MGTVSQSEKKEEQLEKEEIQLQQNEQQLKQEMQQLGSDLKQLTDKEDMVFLTRSIGKGGRPIQRSHILNN